MNENSALSGCCSASERIPCRAHEGLRDDRLTIHSLIQADNASRDMPKISQDQKHPLCFAHATQFRQNMPVTGEKAAWTPCHAPLEVPQKVDQKGAIDSFSTGVNCSWTCTCKDVLQASLHTACLTQPALRQKVHAFLRSDYQTCRGRSTFRGAVIDVGP